MHHALVMTILLCEADSLFISDTPGSCSVYTIIIIRVCARGKHPADSIVQSNQCVYVRVMYKLLIEYYHY